MLLRIPSCLPVTQRTKYQPITLAHSALPHLASAYFQGLTAQFGPRYWNSREFVSPMVLFHVPRLPLGCFFSFVPFFLFLFLLTYSFVFYQDSAKTSLPESQVSLSLSGLLYIIVLTRLD